VEHLRLPQEEHQDFLVPKKTLAPSNCKLVSSGLAELVVSRGPSAVLIMSLSFIGVVFALHVIGKFLR
jgi:hypothetical protein